MSSPLLASFVGVPPWLLRSALRAALWHGLFVAAVTVVKSASNAVFLARADPRALPLLYVVVAGLVAVATGSLGRLLRRVHARRVTTWTLLTSSALVALIIAACAASVPFAPGALYVAGEVWATTVSVLFWTRVGEGFSARDQKRVVGVVGAGGMAGAVVGGVLMTVAANVGGVLWPALLAALLPAVGLPLLTTLRSHGARGHQSALEDDEPKSGARYLRTGRYPLGVAALVVLLAAMGAATDFAFRLASAEALGEAEMAGLFGLLNAVVGASVVFIQLGLTTRLLAKFGVFAFLALVPTGLVALAALPLLGAPSFIVVVAMKGLEMAGAFSLYQAAVSLLYNPMPSSLRGELRALIDGAVKKGGAALAGLSLVGLAWLDRRLVGPPLVALLAVLALFLLPWLRRHYLRALDDKLGRRRRERPGGSSIDASDRVTRRLLLSALERDDPLVVLAALDALGAAATLPPAQLLRLLHHEDERVRQAALARVPDEQPAGEGDELVATLVDIVRGDVARRPRGEAVRALARLRKAALEPLLESLLHDDEPGVVCAAIEAVWSGPQHARVAERLDELCVALRDRPPAWRREIARLIGVTGEARYDAVLSSLLEDPDPSVMSLAAEAAGREQHEAHLPRLLVALGRREERAAARDALVAYGDAALPLLSRALDDVTLPLAQRIHVPRVLAAIGSEGAARALLFSNPRDDAYLQRRIADRLVELCARRPDIEVDRARCDEAVRRRLVAARAHAAASDDLAGEDDARMSLLARVVHERREMALRIALQLVGIHRGMDRAMTALRALSAGPGQPTSRHNDALELLDVHLTGDPLREALLEAFEQRPRRGTHEEASARVLRLARSRDPLVRGIARHTARLLALVSDEADGELDLSRAPPASGDAHEEQLEGDDMAEDLVERLFLLEHVDLFEGLPTDDLAAIAALAAEQPVPPGGVVYEEGDRGDCMYVIIEGELELTRRGAPLLRLHAGESLGQTSFLDRGPRPVTARAPAGKAVRLLAIERGAFMDLLTDRPGLMHALFAVLGQRLRTLIARDAAEAL